MAGVALKEPSSPGVGEDEEMGVYAVAKVQVRRRRSSSRRRRGRTVVEYGCVSMRLCVYVCPGLARIFYREAGSGRAGT